MVANISWRQTNVCNLQEVVEVSTWSNIVFQISKKHLKAHNVGGLSLSQSQSQSQIQTWSSIPCKFYMYALPFRSLPNTTACSKTISLWSFVKQCRLRKTIRTNKWKVSFESLMFDVTTSAAHASNPTMLPNFSNPQTYNINYPSLSGFLNLWLPHPCCYVTKSTPPFDFVLARVE